MLNQFVKRMSRSLVKPRPRTTRRLLGGFENLESRIVMDALSIIAADGPVGGLEAVDEAHFVKWTGNHDTDYSQPMNWLDLNVLDDPDTDWNEQWRTPDSDDILIFSGNHTINLGGFRRTGAILVEKGNVRLLNGTSEIETSELSVGESARFEVSGRLAAAAIDVAESATLMAGYATATELVSLGQDALFTIRDSFSVLDPYLSSTELQLHANSRLEVGKELRVHTIELGDGSLVYVGEQLTVYAPGPVTTKGGLHVGKGHIQVGGPARKTIEAQRVSEVWIESNGVFEIHGGSVNATATRIGTAVENAAPGQLIAWEANIKGTLYSAGQITVHPLLGAATSDPSLGVEGDYHQLNEGVLEFDLLAGAYPFAAMKKAGTPQAAMFQIEGKANLDGVIWVTNGDNSADPEYRKQNPDFRKAIVQAGLRINLIDFPEFEGRFKAMRGSVFPEVTVHLDDGIVKTIQRDDVFYGLDYIAPNENIFAEDIDGQIQLLTLRTPLVNDNGTGKPLTQRNSKGLIVLVPGGLGAGGVGTSAHWTGQWAEKIAKRTTWDIASFDWFAVGNALSGHEAGESLAFWLNELNEQNGNYANVHLLGDSLGTWIIDGISDRLRAIHETDVRIQVTLFDTAVAAINGLMLGRGESPSEWTKAGDSQSLQEELGDTADFAEHYFDVTTNIFAKDYGFLKDLLFHEVLPNAFNILVPSHIPFIPSSPSPHAMPSLLYEVTIEGPVSKHFAVSRGWGFHKSIALGRVPDHTSHSRGCVLRLEDGLQWCGFGDFIRQSTKGDVKINVQPPRAGEIVDDGYRVRASDETRVFAEVDLPHSANTLQISFVLPRAAEGTLSVAHAGRVLHEVDLSELLRIEDVDGYDELSEEDKLRLMELDFTYKSGLIPLGVDLPAGKSEIVVTLTPTGADEIEIILTDFDFARADGNQSTTGADAGGPYRIQVGRSLELDASASTTSLADPNAELTFSWDINGDGNFGDAFGVKPTISYDDLAALGVKSGAYDLRVRIEDTLGNVDASNPAKLSVLGIDDFVVGLMNPSTYEEQHGVLPKDHYDTDGDGDVDFDDIPGIVSMLTANAEVKSITTTEAQSKALSTDEIIQTTINDPAVHSARHWSSSGRPHGTGLGTSHGDSRNVHSVSVNSPADLEERLATHSRAISRKAESLDWAHGQVSFNKTPSSEELSAAVWSDLDWLDSGWRD